MHKGTSGNRQKHRGRSRSGHLPTDSGAYRRQLLAALAAHAGGGRAPARARRCIGHAAELRAQPRPGPGRRCSTWRTARSTPSAWASRGAALAVGADVIRLEVLGARAVRAGRGAAAARGGELPHRQRPGQVAHGSQDLRPGALRGRLSRRRPAVLRHAGTSGIRLCCRTRRECRADSAGVCRCRGHARRCPGRSRADGQCDTRWSSNVRLPIR